MNARWGGPALRPPRHRAPPDVAGAVEHRSSTSGACVKPERDLLDTIVSARDQVRSLRGWNSGPERIYELLRTATKLRAMEISAGMTTDLSWESVLAQIVVWHHDHPVGTGTCSERDAAEIVLAAAAAQRLDLVETGVRSGTYQVRMTRENFRIRHRWNASVEVADMFLERDARPTRLPELSETERRWISTRPVDSRTSPPPEVLRAAVQRASTTIEAHRQSVPEGQVTASDMISVLAVIRGSPPCASRQRTGSPDWRRRSYPRQTPS